MGNMQKYQQTAVEQFLGHDEKSKSMKWFEKECALIMKERMQEHIIELD